jgi:hypothetical protein
MRAFAIELAKTGLFNVIIFGNFPPDKTHLSPRYTLNGIEYISTVLLEDEKVRHEINQAKYDVLIVSRYIHYFIEQFINAKTVIYWSVFFRARSLSQSLACN